MTLIHRRSLITGLVSLLAAPAIVRASSLMPVKALDTTMILTDLSQWDQFGNEFSIIRFCIDRTGLHLEGPHRELQKLAAFLPPPPPDSVGKFFGEIRTVRGDFEQMKYSSPPWEK